MRAIKNNIFFALFVAFSFLCNTNIQAQEYSNRNSISVEASFSNAEVWQYSAGYHYMFYKYAGIGGYIGAWSIVPSSGLIGSSNEDNDNRQNAFIKPTLRLKTPDFLSVGKCRFSVSCEPGAMFSCRQKMQGNIDSTESTKEYKTDCFSWNCNLGLNASFSNATISLFYDISNLDVDRKYENVIKDNYKKNLIGSIGIRLALDF